MKTTKDFRLSKESKRLLATMTDEKRLLWKKSFIEAEIAEKMAKLAKLKERPKTQGEE
jgi:hypothetical protein